MKPSLFPPYRAPGVPAYWMDETSGRLKAAMKNFLAGELGEELGPGDLALVLSYARYVIEAPCWDLNPYAGPEDCLRLRELRDLAQRAQSAADLRLWISACLEVGIDPF